MDSRQIAGLWRPRRFNRHLFVLTLSSALILISGACGIAGPAPRQDKAAIDASAQHLVDSKGNPLRGLDFSKKQYTLIYFSAHWCPPCRAFTPELVNFYNTRKQGDNFELIFVSADKAPGAMLEYMRGTSMPWPALEFGRPEAQRLRQLTTGRGIPCLLLLDPQGVVLSDSYDGSTYRGPHAVLRDLEEKLKPAQGQPTPPPKDAQPQPTQTPPPSAPPRTAAVKSSTVVQTNTPAVLTEEQVKAHYKLKGLLTSGRSRSAMINDTLVDIGDPIGPDAKVKDIKNDRVIIEIGEKTYTLRKQ